jgi:hypothetical protein
MPHEFAVRAQESVDAVTPSDNEVPSVIGELAQVAGRKPDAASNIKIPSSVILRMDDAT